MVQNYMTMFGTNPKLHKSVRAPLEKGYNTDFDILELLDNEDTHKYQSLTGYLQWTIYLGIFDIFTYVMTMNIFRSTQIQVHMERVKRIYVYLDKLRNECIWVQKKEPDLLALSDQKFHWE